MKRRSLTVLVLLAALSVIGMGVWAFAFNEPTARADLGGLLQSALEARSVGFDSIEVSGTDTDIEVVINSGTSGPADALWARVIVEKELSYLKSEGQTSAEWVTVEIVGKDGAVIFGTRQPVQAVSRPSEESVSPADVESISRYVREQAEVNNVVLTDFSITSEGNDTVVSVSLGIPGGSGRDDQLRWLVGELVPRMRSHVEETAGVGVDLYRLHIRDQWSDKLLVEYVVDADRNSVHAWMAEGVTAVWSHTRPASAEDVLK